ncbi:angiopoietin-1 receptor-like [Patiria miniata]|uniref:receptor protein-tyrosine kinase n=1 Tax=Patiria miniata TaxID=46514 RepID=A0A914ABI6_PATMI|nr:angiopoietin-1 receptor-like [Patiria miniata]
MAKFFVVPIFVLILQHATASPSLKILPGSEVLAAPGTNVTLTCTVAGDAVQQAITLKWLYKKEVHRSCRPASGEFPGPTAGPGALERQCNLTVGPIDRSSVGIYKCQFFDGKQLSFQTLKLILDMNECNDESTNDCDVNADCVDLVDDFKCICKNGFIKEEATGICQGNESKVDRGVGVGVGVNNAVVAVCVSVALLIIVVVALGVFALLRGRRNRGRASVIHNALAGTAESTVAMLVASYEDRIAEAAATSHESRIKQRELASKGDSLPSWAKGWEILWSDLLLDDEVLGRGNFGKVRSGAVRIGGKVIRAAIKMLKEHSSSFEKDEFMQEFKIMSSIGHHSNIVWLLGACQYQDVLYVALEYLPHGDLRSYLRTARSQSESDEDALSFDQLVKFALDVAKGMEHLAKAGVIHRDLAARNILIGEALIAKVSDFGLSRGEDVYVQMSSKRVPLRWLAIESVRHHTYTTQSDVWSFGILLWEIVTIGGTPYPTIDSASLPGKLRKGYRMPKPANCDDHSYALMHKCWDEDPNKRPTFTELVSILSGMASDTANNTYLVMEKIRYINLSAIRPEFDDK